MEHIIKCEKFKFTLCLTDFCSEEGWFDSRLDISYIDSSMNLKSSLTLSLNMLDCIETAKSLKILLDDIFDTKRSIVEISTLENNIQLKGWIVPSGFHWEGEIRQLNSNLSINLCFDCDYETLNQLYQFLTYVIKRNDDYVKNHGLDLK